MVLKIHVNMEMKREERNELRRKAWKELDEFEFKYNELKIKLFTEEQRNSIVIKDNKKYKEDMAHLTHKYNELAMAFNKISEELVKEVIGLNHLAKELSEKIKGEQRAKKIESEVKWKCCYCYYCYCHCHYHDYYHSHNLS